LRSNVRIETAATHGRRHSRRFMLLLHIVTPFPLSPFRPHCHLTPWSRRENSCREGLFVGALVGAAPPLWPSSGTPSSASVPCWSVAYGGGARGGRAREGEGGLHRHPVPTRARPLRGSLCFCSRHLQRVPPGAPRGPSSQHSPYRLHFPAFHLEHLGPSDALPSACDFPIQALSFLFIFSAPKNARPLEIFLPQCATLANGCSPLQTTPLSNLPGHIAVLKLLFKLKLSSECFSEHTTPPPSHPSPSLSPLAPAVPPIQHTPRSSPMTNSPRQSATAVQARQPRT
jgi:hypothetical protein